MSNLLNNIYDLDGGAPVRKISGDEKRAKIEQIIKNYNKTVHDITKLRGQRPKMKVEKLENMCKSRGNNYKVITEENTSKTCTGCGKKKEDLGSSEVYKCEKCKIKIDRDVNASRNICIKNIKEYGAIPIKSS
jgi:transposase